MKEYDILAEILPYSQDTRTVQARLAFGRGIGTSTLQALLVAMSEVQAGILACSEESLCKEVGEWIRFRAIFRLLPEACLFGDPIEEKPLIAQHLEHLGIVPTPSLVSAIKALCINFRAKRERSSRKMGIADVRVNYPHTFDSIMQRQGGRCCYCGIALVYGENAQLDHVLPFFLGDDPCDGSNWVFCCGDCNLGKSQMPFYSLDRAVVNWVALDTESKLSIQTRIAALVRDGRCSRCRRRPLEAHLQVVRHVPTGCWVLDNVISVCVDGDACARRLSAGAAVLGAIRSAG